MKTHSPEISVMMCAHNAAKYIGEAIDSILQQSFGDFELIIVDDGSSDNTSDIIQSYTDERIRCIHGQHDYIRSLNFGLHLCRGEFIARMDADDVMMPNRLERQIHTMRLFPDISVCFSWVKTIGSINERQLGHKAKEEVDNAFFWLLTGNFLIHPTAMLRRSFIVDKHLRYKNYPYAEDYKFWTDIARVGGKFYVIPELLLCYRINRSQVSFLYHEEQRDTRLRIQQEIIERLLELNIPQRNSLSKLYRQYLKLNQADLIDGDEIVVLMYKIFRRTGFFD